MDRILQVEKEKSKKARPEVQGQTDTEEVDMKIERETVKKKFEDIEIGGTCEAEGYVLLKTHEVEIDGEYYNAWDFALDDFAYVEDDKEVTPHVAKLVIE